MVVIELLFGIHTQFKLDIISQTVKSYYYIHHTSKCNRKWEGREKQGGRMYDFSQTQPT